MAKKKKATNEVQALPYSSKLSAAVDCTIEHATAKKDIDFLKSIRKWGKKHHILTIAQLRAVGGMYKRIVNNGKYVKHDWWS